MHITNLYPYQNSVIGSLKVDELEVSHADVDELHAKHLAVNTSEIANLTTSHLVATTADIDEVSIKLLNILDTTLAEELNVDGDIKASGSVKIKTDSGDQDDTPYLTIGPNFDPPEPYTFSVSKDGTVHAKDVYIDGAIVEAADVGTLTVGDGVPNMTVQSNGLTTINTGNEEGKAISVTRGESSPPTEAVAISGDGSIILTPTGAGNAISVGSVATISKAGAISGISITTSGTATINALSVKDNGSEVASISSTGAINGTSLTTTDEVSSNTLNVGGSSSNMTVDSDGKIRINAGAGSGGDAFFSVYADTNNLTSTISRDGTFTGTKATINGNGADVGDTILTVGSSAFTVSKSGLTTINSSEATALSIHGGASISSAGNISGKSLTLTGLSGSTYDGRTLKLDTGGAVTSSTFAGTTVCNYTEDKQITVSTFGTPSTGTFNVTEVGVTGNVTNGFAEVFNDNSLCALDTGNGTDGTDGTSFELSPGYHRFSVTTNFSVVSDTPTHSRMFSIVVGAIPTTTLANTSIWYGLDSFTSFTDTDTETVDNRRGMFVSKTFTFVVTCSTKKRMRLGVMFGSKKPSFNPADSVKFSHRAIGPTRPSPDDVKALWNIVTASGPITPIANPTVVQIDSWAIGGLVDSGYRMDYPSQI